MFQNAYFLARETIVPTKRTTFTSRKLALSIVEVMMVGQFVLGQNVAPGS
jgi:hypothetical protein